MKQLCAYVISFAFKELGLNRVMANYMPKNIRSECLLRSLGFEREGFARKYLCINGKWEDHVLTSLINPKNMYHGRAKDTKATARFRRVQLEA